MSTSKRVVQMTKPTPDRAEKALSFAEKAAPAQALAKPAAPVPEAKKPAVSGRVPENDVRLTANIDKQVHKDLKMLAAFHNTTIGELIEHWVTVHRSEMFKSLGQRD